MQFLFALAILFDLTTFSCASAQSNSGTAGWVGSWSSSQQLLEPQEALAADDLRDATLRQVVHLSAGGPALRIRLSNAFGTLPLHLTSVHIARPISPASAQIDPATDRALSFSGSRDVTVPAGADFFSDPIEFPVNPSSDLTISIHYDAPPAQQTGHSGARATSYTAHGDLVSAADLPAAKKVDHWYQLSGVDVATPSHTNSIVILGDSITDGHGATTNGNDRWTDVLAARLRVAAPGGTPGVLNAGIGGNHLLTDGLGPNALARFDRDVLAQSGIRYLIVLEGVNDLGGLERLGHASPSQHDALVNRVLAAYQQIVMRAHQHGILVYGGTITPYVGSTYYHPEPAGEADRQRVNQWIRTPGNFDAVIDFDHATADPEHPDRLLPAYDSGDHLHPSPVGYRAMGEAVSLSLFKR